MDVAFLLLFRHNDKNSTAQEKSLTNFTLSVTRFHLPHAIAVMLHVHKLGVVILKLETAGTCGV